MMHLLPSTIKKEKVEDGDAEDSSSYKKRKEAKDKANSARYSTSSQIPRKCQECIWGLHRGCRDSQS